MSDQPDTAVGVCGFGRCGSTMAMAMLTAGGVPEVAGTHPISHELSSSDGIAALTSDQVAGRAVKLLDAILHGLMPQHDGPWAFIWMNRNQIDQGRSQVKLLNSATDLRLRDADAWRFARSYRADKPLALHGLRARGPVLELAYAVVLTNPRAAAEELAAFLHRHTGHDLDIDAAAAAVHQRDARMAPDLTFELTGRPPEAVAHG